MKKIISFLLVVSLIVSGCQSTAGLSASQAQMVNQDNREITDFVVGTCAFVVGITAIVIIAVHNELKKQKAAQAAAEAQFRACVGKTKAEIYALYGPPKNIVDDAQGQGGTILEYLSINTYGGDGTTPAYTITYRKLFYLNKDNVVTSVKEDTQ